jgi:Kef-type K+ transport system membrane component KefB
VISPFKTLILGCFTVLSHLGAFYIIYVPVVIGEIVLGIVVTNGAKKPLYGYLQIVHKLSCERR